VRLIAGEASPVNTVEGFAGHDLVVDTHLPVRHVEVEHTPATIELTVGATGEGG
jgi:hypothetical protein